MRNLLTLILLLCSMASSAGELRPLAFSDDLTLEDLRAPYAHLSDDAFRAKLAASLTSPLLFFRSYVNSYYRDFAQFPHSGRVIACLGDAHPENFGFIEFAGRTRYVFNDLDDGGDCPLELDALRYFTAVLLTYQDDELLGELLREYARARQGAAPQPLPEALQVELAPRRQSLLLKLTRNNLFIPSPEYASLGPKEHAELKQGLAQLPLLKPYRVLDFVQVVRSSGGSAGLRRYWVLVARGKWRDVLELKEEAKPGVSFLTSGAERPERLAELKEKVWQESPRFYHSVKFQNKTFLLRSRTKESISLDKTKSKLIPSVLKAQVGLLGEHHRRQHSGWDEAEQKWLEASARQLASRYRKLLTTLTKELRVEGQSPRPVNGEKPVDQ